MALRPWWDPFGWMQDAGGQESAGQNSPGQGPGANDTGSRGPGAGYPVWPAGLAPWMPGLNGLLAVGEGWNALMRAQWTALWGETVPVAQRMDIEHADDVAALHAQCFARPWPAREIEAMLCDDRVCGTIARAGATTAGFILTRQAADEAEILSLCTGETIRRRGVARLLLGHQLAILGARQVTRVFLEVEEANAAARALYDGFGFEQVGARPKYYRSANGIDATALVLRCTLS